jgi:NADP-dependent 3-hydroxy acid dehydrogenase YdfG
MSIVATARRSERLDELGAEGDGWLLVPGDIRDASHRERVVQSAIDRWGRVDVLVNAAGHGRGWGAVGEASWEDCADQLDVNLAAPMHLASLCTPTMKSAGCGTIIFLGSMLSSGVAPGYAVYSSTKRGLRTFASVLGAELAPFGVAVSLIEPGAVMTEFSAVATPAHLNIPLTTPPGSTAESVADAIVWVLERRTNFKVTVMGIRPEHQA